MVNVATNLIPTTHLANSTITIERVQNGYSTTIFVSDKDLIECQNPDWSCQIDEAFEKFQQELCYILGIKQEDLYGNY